MKNIEGIKDRLDKITNDIEGLDIDGAETKSMVSYLDEVAGTLHSLIEEQKGKQKDDKKEVEFRVVIDNEGENDAILTSIDIFFGDYRIINRFYKRNFWQDVHAFKRIEGGDIKEYEKIALFTSVECDWEDIGMGCASFKAYGRSYVLCFEDRKIWLYEDTKNGSKTLFNITI